MDCHRLWMILCLFGPYLAVSQPLVSARLDGKYGLLDSTGRWYLAPQYDSLRPFYHQSVAYWNNGKFGVLDPRGKIISPPVWNWVGYEEEGMIAVYDGNYYGFISVQGKTRIEPQFLEVDYFREGLCGASKLDGIWGFIDSSGRWVIPPYFYFVSSFENGRAWVDDGEEQYYINRLGQRLEEDSVLPAIPIRVLVNGKTGIQRPDSGWLIPPEYENLSLSFGGLYFFYDGKGWGLLDTTNTVLYPAKFDQYKPFSEGLAAVQLHGKWGFINTRGEVVIPCLLEEAEPFSCGMAAVKLNGLWGAIGRDGLFLIPPRYELLLGGFQPIHPNRASGPDYSGW